MAFTYNIRTKPIEYAGRMKVVFGDFTTTSTTTTGDIPTGLSVVHHASFTVTSTTGLTVPAPTLFGTPPYTSGTITARFSAGTMTCTFIAYGLGV